MSNVSRSTRYSTPRIQDDEVRILDAVKRRSDLQDKIGFVMGTKSQRKQQTTLEELAIEFNTTVDVLKKVLLKTRKDEEEGEVEEETRPRSASSIEPRKTRRSLRSQSIDRNVSTASTAKYESTDTSCTSSMCGSPPKTEQSIGMRRSRRRTLRAINEDDIVNLDSTLLAPVTVHQEDESKQELVDVNEAIDNQRQTVDDSVPNVASASSTSSSNASTSSVTKMDISRYLESTLPDTKNNRILRLSEPLQTPCNGQPIHSSIGTTSRRLSAATNNISGTTNTVNKGIGKTQTASENSTRIFFDSIGLTVMNFPQHLQASVKSQVSNIVHELEFKLSSPIDKTTAVAS